MLIIFFLFALPINAQETKLDSILERALDKKLDYLNVKSNNLALNKILLNSSFSRNDIDKQIKTFIKNKNSSQIIILYSVLSNAVVQSNPEYALHFLNEGLQYVRAGDNVAFTDIYGNIGAAYAIMGIDDLGLKNMLTALNYIYKDSTKDNIPVKKLLLANIAEMYLNQHNLPLAVKYNKQSLALDESSSKKSKFLLLSKTSELLISAEISYRQGKISQAKNYLIKGIQISKEILDINKESEQLAKLGEYEEDINRKIGLLQKSYQLAHQQNTPNAYSINSSIKLIGCYLSILENRPKELSSKYTNSYLSASVQQLWNEVREDIKIIGSKKDLASIYNLYSRYAKWKGNYQSAFEYIEKYYRLNDSIYSQENKNKLAALQSANDIALRDQQIAIGKENFKQRTQQVWILIVSLVAVCILGVLLFYQNRLTKKKNEELDEANRTKIIFFNILNHDLRSPLGDLINFLHLKEENMNVADNQAPIMDDETLARLDKQTLGAVENLLILMEDILLWSKGQMEHFLPHQIHVSVSKLFSEMKLHFSVKENITITFENNENITLYTDQDYLRTILRNLTSNAIKVLENRNNPNITWKAFSRKGKLVLSITDNGPGGTDEQFKALYDEKATIGIQHGLGLHLIRDMAKAIKCEVKVIGKSGFDTTIELQF